MKFKYDVIIVGASLSGSSAALHLARAGRSVCLIDKAAFPRSKPCGEGLSPQGAAIIRSLGLSRELAETPHCALDGYTLHWGQTTVSIPFVPQGSSDSEITTEFGLGIKRQILDEMLVSKCRNSNQIAVFDKSPVTSIIVESPGFEIEIPGQRVNAQRLIIADGASSPSSRLLGIQSIGRKSPKKSAFTCGYSGTWSAPTRKVHILNYPGLRLFISPVGADEVSVALLTSPRMSRILSSSKQRDVLISTSFKTIGFSPVKSLQGRGSSNIGHRRRPAHIGGAYLVGDAVEQLDPIGGMGMTHALFSGKFAAEAITANLTGECTETEAEARYQVKREAAMIPLRGFTRMVEHAFLLAEHLPVIRPFLGSAIGVAASREVHQLERLSPLSGFTAKCLLCAAGFR